MKTLYFFFMMIDFKRYLHGPLSLGSRLMFRFRSGNVALRGPMSLSDRTVSPACPCCGADEESVVHCLVQCPLYAPARAVCWSQLSQAVGDAVFASFLSASPSEQGVRLLSHRWWAPSIQPDVCGVVKQFLCDLWGSRKRHLAGAQVSRTHSRGSAPSGGAEGYGQLTMPSTS